MEEQEQPLASKLTFDPVVEDQGPSCSNCNTLMEGMPKFCVHCGFPEHGTDQEKAKFHANQALQRSKLKVAPRQIKSARNTLFIIGGIQLIFGLIVYFTSNLTEELIAAMIIFLVYLLLGFWSQTKPLIALILGLLVYLTLIALSAIGDPSTLVKGIIIKIIIIAYLGKGINSALELRKQQNAD